MVPKLLTANFDLGQLEQSQTVRDRHCNEHLMSDPRLEVRSEPLDDFSSRPIMVIDR